MINLVERAKFRLAIQLIELKSAWRSAVCVYKAATDGKGYPWSLKEIWDSQTGLTCGMLRGSVEDLVHDFPHIPPKYIRGLLSTPMTFQHMGGKSPFQAVLDEPTVDMMGNAKIAIRRDVYDLDELSRSIPGMGNPSFNRSFFVPELRVGGK